MSTPRERPAPRPEPAKPTRDDIPQAPELDPNGQHGLVVCVGCHGRTLHRKCECHPDTVAVRIPTCRRCRIPSPELVRLAEEACLALQVGRRLPRAPASFDEPTDHDPFSDFDPIAEAEKRYP